MKTYTWKKASALLLAMALLLSACQSGQPAPGEETTPSTQETGTVSEPVTDAAEGEVDKSVYMNPEADVEDRIAALLAQMTLEEKAAQMVQAEQSGLSTDAVTKYGIGSVLSGGGSAPLEGNSAENWQARINELKQAALDSRLGIPLLYGVDAVHGNNNVFGATVFPHNIGLGAANNEELITRIGEITASEVRAVGIQWTFAPTLGNPQNERWGRTYECFSERAEDVAGLGAAYIRGFQGTFDSNGYMDEKHVIACAKHFIGEGYTEEGINQGNVAMSAEEFDALLASGILDPYTNAVNENVLTFMVSYNSVDGLKCHENYHLIQEVLKDEMGFKGLVVSDYNGVQQVSGATYKDQVELAVNAGIDLLMEPYGWEMCIQFLVELVEEGRISETRIDDAVSRILRVKFTAGLFEEEIGSAAEQECLAAFGSEEHREVARQAVRESLVLLKNDMVGETTAINALQDCKNIVVSGQKAFDIGSQCGGWTISWEGRSGKTTLGTTIIEGLAKQVGEDVKLSHNVDGNVSSEYDAVIVVVGENPYVETGGDRKAENLTVSIKDQELLEALRVSLDALPDRENTPVIAVIIAGRPINITEYMDMFDAVVMAWLPGTEGEGVADVLLGDYDFTGTLKYTWMKSPLDIEKKQEEGNEDLVLFPYGHGLKKDGSGILGDIE